MDVQTIVATILAAHRVGSTPQQRTAEVQLFEQLKSGEALAAAGAGSELTQPAQPMEAQLMGYAVLQHLVGNRWEDFPLADRGRMATMAYALLRQAAQEGMPWVVRSKAALLLALAIKRSGPASLEAAVSQLLEEAAAAPRFQEAACLVLHYLADEVVQFTDDLAADELRELVQALTDILGPVLQFVERAIEVNFAAVNGEQKGAVPGAAAHVAAVQAALDLAQAVVEWAPVATVETSGLVTAAGFLLRSPEFREPACGVLLRLAGRRLTADEEVGGFERAMRTGGEALLAAAEALLAPGAASELGFEGDNEAFGGQICEAMATMGINHLTQAMPDPSRRVAFLQAMLAFASHPFLLLADKALALWAKLLQDEAASAAAAAAAAVAAPAEPSAAPPSPPKAPKLPAEAVVALMQLAASHLQERNPHTPHAEDDVPPYFDSFEDYKEFMINYRLKLSTIVKSAAAVLPQQALQAAGTQLATAVAAAAAAAAAGTAAPSQALDQAKTLLESAVVFVGSVGKAVWDAADGATTPPAERGARTQAVVAAMEPMLQSLLSLRVTDSQLLQGQAKGLSAFARLMKARPDLLPIVVARVFELLVGCIPLETGGQVAPPARPPPGWREGLQARADVASVMLDYAKAAPEAFLPHLEAIARRLTELWDQAQVRLGERNIINEALLGASLAGPEQLQASIADWALAPVRAAWASAEWQAKVGSPQAFLQHYVHIEAAPGEPGGVVIGCSAERWALYHEVHMVERAVRRMTGAGAPGPHPLVLHMAWAVPQLLRLVSCLNAIHTPAGKAALGAASAAVEMAPQERALYLWRGLPGRKAVVGAGADSDSGDYSSVGGRTVSSLRAWLRHLREFTFHTLGMLPVQVPGTLDIPGLAAAFAPAVLGYIDALEHQHARLVLRHVTIPFVKSTPAPKLAEWVLPQLALLMPHMQVRLAAAWEGMLSGPAATPTTVPTTEGSEAANEEIIRERMMRELTQEYAMLLSHVAERILEDPHAAAPAEGTLLLQAPGVGKQAKPTGPTLLQLLLEREPTAGIAAAAAAVQGMQLPDEAAFRFAMFCRALAALAPADAQLYAYVGSEVLKAAITSLASELMSTHTADILGLIRNVLLQQISDPGSAVHGVLRSLPGVTAEREKVLFSAFKRTGSEKEQRNAVKKFLVQACGAGSFAALADWRAPAAVPVAAITSRRTGARVANAAQLAPGDAHADEKLQGDITRALFE